MERIEYVQFTLKKSDKKKNEYYFNNLYGPSPYIQQNILNIPSEMIKDEYVNKYTKNKQPKSQYKEEKKDTDFVLKEPTGLVNIGGVCYMNAALQCFYHCLPLTNYFLNIDNEAKNNLGLVSRGYLALVKGLNSGDSRAAIKFKEAMIRTDDTFEGNEGKDSKDVAILILTELHSELKENENSVLFLDNNVNQNDKEEIYKEKEKLDKANKNNTIISDTFHFYVLYEQKCSPNCIAYSKSVYNVETDNIIIFELEKIYNDIHKENKNYQRYQYQRSISVEECLEHYITKEYIDCPFCKTKSLKIRKSICKLPKIFIFVLSRGLNAHFDCKINFKNSINMKKYYSPINDYKRDKNTVYELIGATFAYDWSYSGTGHTVAFCKDIRNNGNYPKYYVFNDSSVRKTDISEINEKVPYLLFYEKKN